MKKVKRLNALSKIVSSKISFSQTLLHIRNNFLLVYPSSPLLFVDISSISNEAMCRKKEKKDPSICRPINLGSLIIGFIGGWASEKDSTSLIVHWGPYQASFLAGSPLETFEATSSFRLAQMMARITKLFHLIIHFNPPKTTTLHLHWFVKHLVPSYLASWAWSPQAFELG